MVVRKVYPRYRYEGRFFGRRVNCEQVPLLPAQVVSRMLNDPRKIPYLLIWRSRRDNTVQEAARICAEIEPSVPFPSDWKDMVEIKRLDGTRNFIRTVVRRLPRKWGSGSILSLFLLSDPQSGALRLGAWRTVHFECTNRSVAMPKVFRAEIRIGRRRACLARSWKLVFGR